MSLTYVTGDATDPQVEGPKIIAHVCNNVGGWGRGFVVSVSKRYPQAESWYRTWHTRGTLDGFKFELGATQFVPVKGPPWAYEVFVANMIAQKDIYGIPTNPPIRYDALETCLNQVAVVAQRLSASIHMPRIGCGLAGGRWAEVEPIVARTLVGVPSFVYDFDTHDERTIQWNK